MPDDTAKLRATVGGNYTAESTGQERRFEAGELVDPAELAPRSLKWMRSQGVLVDADELAKREAAAAAESDQVAVAEGGPDAELPDQPAPGELGPDDVPPIPTPDEQLATEGTGPAPNIDQGEGD